MPSETGLRDVKRGDVWPRRGSFSGPCFADVFVERSGILTGLSLDNSAGFISHPHRNLGQATAALNCMSQSIAHDVALNCGEVLQRTAARDPADGINVLGHTLLRH